MAARQAVQRQLLLLRRTPERHTTVPLATRRAVTPLGAGSYSLHTRLSSSLAAAPRPVVTTRNQGGKSVGFSSSGVRWYSVSNENQLLGSRIWKFEEIKKLVDAENPEEKVVIVDVREPSELHETGKIPGAINIPITTAVQSFHISEEDFEDMYGYARPPKEANLLFYCKAGVRARAAAGLAQHAGWKSVGEYPGSWLEWAAHQGPVEKV